MVTSDIHRFHHVGASGAGSGVEREDLDQRLFQAGVIWQCHFDVELGRFVVLDHFAGDAGFADGLGSADRIHRRHMVGHVATGSDDQVVVGQGVQHVDDVFHVFLLGAVQHQGGQRDVAADGDVVTVGDCLG